VQVDKKITADMKTEAVFAVEPAAQVKESKPAVSIEPSPIVRKPVEPAGLAASQKISGLEKVVSSKKTVNSIPPTKDKQSSETAARGALLAQELPVADNLLASSFEATFSGDCWFKLVKGDGKTPFAALKRSGDHVSYSGVGPFTVVLGDASKANIIFDGNEVNLEPHTARNGRAQFTLVSKGADTQSGDRNGSSQ